MRSVALIFPGQGAQKLGMGLEFYQSSKAARKIFDEADMICPNLSKVIFDGPEEKLTSTAFCQPAILTMSIAALRAFEAHEAYKKINVSFAAGLSLGEYSALVASGSINFSDALRLVQQRAAFMEEAALMTQGSMAAVIGFDHDKLAQICIQSGAQIANFNSHEQIVITGSKQAVESAIGSIKAQGGQKIIPLSVSGGFHSSLMSSAASKFKIVLNDVNINPSLITVLSNVTAQPHQDAAGMRLNLELQITSSVQWVRSVEYIVSRGVTNFIEIGPGRVLKGLMRRINPSANVFNIEKPSDIDNLPLP
ncbi:MAG: ACP S-malonyltransferase [Candidatus Omnitrophica bacterium]|nr:ACP S-malonyltransferase [Candidatus Omnitrophota bacterium]